ncbi:MAG: EAL domain-containing protein [Campylobacterota bacterium]
MQRMNLFIVFAFVLFIAMGLKTYEQYNNIKKTQELIIQNESQSLANFISAFRQTYQDVFIRHHIDVDEKTIHLLPVKTTAEISERFSSSVQGDITVRTVSDRPRNPDNAANPFESEMIRYFLQNPKEKQRFVQKEKVFYFTQPLRIKKTCLQCHGKREDAIPSIRDNYDTAYDYKVGDIRGLLSIEIKERDLFKALYADFISNMGITILIYLVFLLIIYLLIQKMRVKALEYTGKLETEIQKKTDELIKQKDTFETLFEKSSDGISILEDGKFTQCNEKVVEMLQYNSKEDLLHTHPSKLSPAYQPDGRSSFEKAEEMMNLAVKNGWHQFEWVHAKASGEEFWAEITLTPIVLNNRDVIHVIWRDISEKKRAKEALIEQHKYLQTIIDGIEDPIMVIDEDYTVQLMNSKVRQNMDLDIVSDIDHPKCYEVSHHRSTPCDSSEHPCPLKMVLETKRTATVIHDHSRSKVEKHYLELSLTPLFDSSKNIIGIIESARDITAHLEVQDKLREQKNILHHQAHHDTLTGLPNRVLFNDRLHQSAKKAKRNNSGLALFFVDLDRFKQINDSLGHEVGDKVLRAVAQRLSDKIRKEDTLARLGGDEFTIIMEELSTVHDAVLLAEKILKVMSDPIVTDGHTLYVTCSIGISLYPEDGTDIGNLLKYADTAMYQAKDDGRNNYQFYSAEMTEMAFERVVMEASLRQALEKEEFLVYYQPQVDASSEKPIGVEALVRWQHPVMGMVSPAKFITLAEETGLIVEIDRWVMKTAIKQVAQWYEDGLNPGVLSLNLAMKQIASGDFLDLLQQTMTANDFKAEWLELEVTEGQVMKRPDEAIIKLKQISDLGAAIAIDDFGTGYSSLSYLKRLPINKLKIDKSFIQDTPGDEEDVAIVKAIIALARSLNLDLLAEGVETEAQIEFLIDNGCKNIQGYYFSRPVPPKEIPEFLSKSL